MTTNDFSNDDNQDFIGGRIMGIIKHYALNRNSFSMKIGLTSNSLITRITKDPGMGMAIGHIQKILKTFPEINPGWFILGEGEMLKKNIFPDPKLHYIKYYKEIEGEPVDHLRITDFEDCDVAFDIVGSGMTPKYRTGDVVICKSVSKEEKIQYGEAYIIIYDNKPMIRYIKSKIDDGFKLGAEDARYEESSIEIKDIQRLYLIKGLIRKETF